MAMSSKHVNQAQMSSSTCFSMNDIKKVYSRSARGLCSSLFADAYSWSAILRKVHEQEQPLAVKGAILMPTAATCVGYEMIKASDVKASEAAREAALGEELMQAFRNLKNGADQCAVSRKTPSASRRRSRHDYDRKSKRMTARFDLTPQLYAANRSCLTRLQI
eukprot:6206167-Pleurochrysis_carterae.AAC.2